MWEASLTPTPHCRLQPFVIRTTDRSQRPHTQSFLRKAVRDASGGSVAVATSTPATPEDDLGLSHPSRSTKGFASCAAHTDTFRVSVAWWKTSWRRSVRATRVSHGDEKPGRSKAAQRRQSLAGGVSHRKERPDHRRSRAAATQNDRRKHVVRGSPTPAQSLDRMPLNLPAELTSIK
jgi:hypothetical protein